MAKPAVPPGAARSENSPLPSRAREQSDCTDDALLAAFRAAGDQGAFAEMASRHGAMVFRTCLRHLGNVHDAEDAAQAVFLQLARAPARARGSLGGWLHKVAGDTAVTLLRARARRARHEEKAAMQKATSQPPTEEALREELDRGIARLPTRLREAVILCFLEGRKQEDAARILGCNQGTLSRWASDGLDQLRAILARRGAVVTSVALVGFFAQQKATAAVPASLLGSLGIAATGKAAVSASVGALANATVKAMAIAKLKLAAAMVLAVTVVGTSAVVALRPADKTVVYFQENFAAVPAGNWIGMRLPPPDSPAGTFAIHSQPIQNSDGFAAIRSPWLAKGCPITGHTYLRFRYLAESFTPKQGIWLTLKRSDQTNYGGRLKLAQPNRWTTATVRLSDFVLISDPARRPAEEEAIYQFSWIAVPAQTGPPLKARLWITDIVCFATSRDLPEMEMTPLRVR